MQEPQKIRNEAIDNLFEQLGSQADIGEFWSELLRIPTDNSIPRAEAPDTLSSSVPIHSGVMKFRNRQTLQQCHELSPCKEISSRRQVSDTQNYRGAHFVLRIQFGTFSDGDCFVAGELSEAGAYYATGAGTLIEQPTPRLFEFEFHAAPDAHHDIKGLRQAVPRLRDAFAKFGPLGVQDCLVQLKKEHHSADSYLARHPQLALRLGDALSSEDPDDPRASRERGSSPRPYALSVLAAPMWRALRKVSDVSRAELLAAQADLTLAPRAKNLWRSPPLEMSTLLTTTAIPFSSHAWVRLLTPGIGRAGFTLGAWVPSRSARGNSDLSLISFEVIGPPSWCGMRMVYRAPSAGRFIHNPDELRTVLHALHKINLHHDPPVEEKLHHLLGVMHGVGLVCHPASLAARLARLDLSRESTVSGLWGR